MKKSELIEFLDRHFSDDVDVWVETRIGVVRRFQPVVNIKTVKERKKLVGHLPPEGVVVINLWKGITSGSYAV